MDEAHERLAQQLTLRVTEHPLERGIHTGQMAVEVGDTQQIE